MPPYPRGGRNEKFAQPMALIAMVWSIATGFNFLLTPYAEMATLTVPIVQITTDMGINPYPVILAFYQGLDQVVMPYESFPYLYLFSFGIVAMKDFMKFFGIKLVLNLIYILCLAVPYWMVIGLL